MEDLPPSLGDVIEETHVYDELHTVLLVQLKAHAESPPACLEVAEGELYCHVAPAQTIVEVLLLAVQLPPISLHHAG